MKLKEEELKKERELAEKEENDLKNALALSSQEKQEEDELKKAQALSEQAKKEEDEMRKILRLSIEAEQKEKEARAKKEEEEELKKAIEASKKLENIPRHIAPSAPSLDNKNPTTDSNSQKDIKTSDTNKTSLSAEAIKWYLDYLTKKGRA